MVNMPSDLCLSCFPLQSGTDLQNWFEDSAFSYHFHTLPQHNQVTTLASGKMHYGECDYRINHMSGQAGGIFPCSLLKSRKSWQKNLDFSSFLSNGSQEGQIQVSRPGARQEKPPRWDLTS